MQTWQRRLWLGTLASGAILLVLLGVLVGLFRIAVSVVPGYRAEVESRVADLLDTPVSIGEMDLRWRGLYPTLNLLAVRLGEDEARLQLDGLDIGFSLPRLIRADVTPRRIILYGAHVQARWQDGQVHLGGVKAQGGEARPPQEFLDKLLEVGDVLLRDTSIVWLDQDHALAARVLAVNELAIQRQDNGLLLNLDAALHGNAGSLQMQALLQGEPNWQLVSLQAQTQDITPWAEIRAWFPKVPALRGRLSSMQLSSQWAQGQWQSAELDFDLLQLGSAEDATAPRIKRWQAQLQAEAQADGYRVRIDNQRFVGQQGEWPVSVQHLDLRPQASEDGQSATWRVAWDADFLRLDDLHGFFPLLPQAAAEALQETAPRGDLHQMVVHMHRPDRWPSLTARAENLSWRHWRKIPGLSGLSGTVSLDESGGRMQVLSEQMVLDAPSIFPQALPINSLSGAVSWQRLPGGWRLEAPGLSYAALSLDGVGRLAVDILEKPRLDLDLSFFCPDPLAFKAYLPKFWSKPLKNWLNAAVQAAKVDSGRIQINGRLGELYAAQSLFQINLDLADVELKFAPDWPAMQAKSVDLLLDGRAISGTAREGRVASLSFAQAQASLPDSRDPNISVQTRFRGDAKDMWRMLGASNLRQHMAETLDALDMAGRAQVDLSLQLPLKDMRELDYRGVAQLESAALWTKYWPTPVQSIRGEVEISRAGLRAKDVQARLGDQAFVVQLRPDNGVTHIEAHSELALLSAAEEFPIPRWLAKRAQGKSRWDLHMAFGPGVSTELKVQSNLIGTAWDLPTPYGKDAEQARQLKLQLIPGKPTRVNLNYGDNLGFDALLADEQIQASRLHVGGSAIPAVAPGVWVEGELLNADMDDWWPLIYDMSQDVEAGGKPPLFGGLVLQLGQLTGIDQTFDQVRMQLTQADRSNENDLKRFWRMQLSGGQVAGELWWPVEMGAGRGLIEGQFERLHWHWMPQGDAGQGSPPDPSQYPAINVQADQFILNQSEVGPLNLQVQAIERGWQIQSMSIGDPRESEMTASGLWVHDEQGSAAALDFSLDSRNMAPWLSAFDYDRSMAAEEGRFSGRLSWSPDPKGLLTKNLGGELSIELKKGRLLTIEPGAGRMLGLLSITALPRRFILDFGDVVDSGFGFDRIAGQFNLAQGIAHTEDLEVKGTSLRIAAQGDVDLDQRLYDQNITIYPGLSSGVSLAATVLGGPAMGLFLLFAQELLDKPLDQVTQISYHLGGSWDNPVVERKP